MTQTLVTLGTGIVMLSLAGTTQADSAKLVNSNNGHTYQRFDIAKTWEDAKTSCADLSAHLATITSQEENDWIISNMLQGVSFVWLGATDAAQEGVWKWITGETWSYTNWFPFEPNNAGRENYLSTFGNQPPLKPGLWNDLNEITPYYSPVYYLCEWESSQYLNVTAIQDVNGDGVIDQAVLALKSGNYYLQTIDSATGKKLKQVSLGTTANITPSALTSVGQQISVLITKSTGVTVLQLRDNATLAIVKTLMLSK